MGAVEEIQAAQKAATQGLRESAATLSTDIANQILGREVEA